METKGKGIFEQIKNAEFEPIKTDMNENIIRELTNNLYNAPFPKNPRNGKKKITIGKEGLQNYYENSGLFLFELFIESTEITTTLEGLKYINEITKK